MAMKEYFEIDGVTVPFAIVRKKGQKHINIRISHTGDLRVSAPHAASDARIRKALASKKVWLSRRLTETNTRAPMMDPLRRIMIDGQWLETRIVREKSADRLYIDSAQGILRLYAPELEGRSGETAVTEELTALLGKTIRKWARKRLIDDVCGVSAEYDIGISRIFVRNQRTRWGSSSGRGNLSLNWRAVMLPPDVRRYLILHELAHQREMNHSRAFWRRVAAWCPEYESHDRWLKGYSFLLGVLR